MLPLSAPKALPYHIYHTRIYVYIRFLSSKMFYGQAGRCPPIRHHTIGVQTLVIQTTMGPPGSPLGLVEAIYLYYACYTPMLPGSVSLSI